MKNLRVCLPILLTALVSANIWAADNSQHWHDNRAMININPRLSLDIYNRNRWRDFPFATTFQTCVQGGLVYKLTPEISSLLAYRYDMANKTGYYEFENRFLLEFAFKLPLIKQFAFGLTQRTELRYFTRSTPDNVRLRFAGNISRKVTAYGLKFTPSLTGELFWDDQADEINRFRLYVGSGYTISQHYSVKLIYIREFNKTRPDLDIIDTGFNIVY